MISIAFSIEDVIPLSLEVEASRDFAELEESDKEEQQCSVTKFTQLKLSEGVERFKKIFCIFTFKKI